MADASPHGNYPLGLRAVRLFLARKNNCKEKGAMANEILELFLESIKDTFKALTEVSLL